MSGLIDPDKLKQIVEAALMAADEPLTVDQLQKLFAHGELDSDEGRAQIRDTLKSLEDESAGRGYELKRVSSGYRYQVRQELAAWVSRLWEEKPPRYTRALLETLALIAYKQPVTRGDIEQVRGVSVSQNIMRTLQERGWIRVVGQREVPGRPSLYGTTRQFLDYFDLKSLDQLPPLSEIRSLIEPLAEDHDQGMDMESSADGGEDQEIAAETAAAQAQHDGSEPVGPRRAAAEDRGVEEGQAVESDGAEVAVGEAVEVEDGDQEARDAEGRRAEARGDEDRGGAGDEAEDGGAEESRAEDAEQNEPAPHSAEVVRLPTAPRR